MNLFYKAYKSINKKIQSKFNLNKKNKLDQKILFLIYLKMNLRMFMKKIFISIRNGICESINLNCFNLLSTILICNNTFKVYLKKIQFKGAIKIEYFYIDQQTS